MKPEDAAARGATEVVTVTDPAGDEVEFARQPFNDAIDRFISPNGVRFVTGDQGLGHFTKAVRNYSECVHFYLDVLGFDQRESIDIKIRASFSGPNPRHHSIALIDGDGHTHPHHIMVEVDALDDVGRCLDRVLKGEAPLTVNIGRHFNDRMTSFYMSSPSGLQVEYGWAGLRVDAGTWVEYAQGGVGGASLWGHQPAEAAEHGAVSGGLTRAVD